jgi:serine/threonine protein kinase
MQQIVDLLSELHKRSYIHRDIKPQNIVMGLNENQNRVYLIDFGISKRYLDMKKRHIPFKDARGFCGTARYVSLNVHNGIEATRRDDLESVLYMAI